MFEYNVGLERRGAISRLISGGLVDAERERRRLTDCDELDEATLKRNPNNAVITFITQPQRGVCMEGLSRPGVWHWREGLAGWWEGLGSPSRGSDQPAEHREAFVRADYNPCNRTSS